MKIKPFMTKKSSRIFIGTIILVQPYWVVEIYATFTFFNDLPNRHLFSQTRPIETIFRDPWWVAACIKLIWTLKRRQYNSSTAGFQFMNIPKYITLEFVAVD